MARRSYLRFLSDPDGIIEVAVADGQGVETLSGGLADLKNRDGVVVFVPATDIGWHSVSLPARNEREARRAAVFAIEDDLASNADAIHVSVSEKTDDGSRIVLTCEETTMQAWLDRLQAEGVSPFKIVPEHAVLPAENCAIDLGNRVVSRINGQAMGLDHDGPDDLLRAVLATAQSTVEIHGAELARRAGMPLTSNSDTAGVAQLASLAEANGLGHDLRQGKFANRKNLDLPDIKTWQRPLALAATAALVWLGITAWETASLNQSSNALRAQASGIYAAAFAEEGAVPNPASRTQAKLAQGAGTSLDFERTAAILFQTLEEVDGARLRSMRFDGAAAELRASVDYASYGDDLRLAEFLGKSGLNAVLGDTRASGTAITGDVTVKAAP
ncbi:MAG: type II secretion system protein GspL [Pseudomonadota bacterium]